MATLAQHFERDRRPEPVPRTHLPVDSLLMIGLSLLALVLRLWHIDATSIWVDEAVSINIARLSWHDFYRVMKFAEANMGLYYFLLHYWIKISSNEVFLRSFSVLFGTATVPLLYSLGRKLFGRFAAATSAVLLALSAFHIAYSQQARGYTLAVFLVVGAAWAFVRGMEDRSARAWIAYSLLVSLAGYTHFYAALVVPALSVAALFYDRRTLPWKSFLLANSTVTVLLVPMFIYVRYHDVGQISWIPPLGWNALRTFGFDFAGREQPLLIALSIPLIVLSLTAWIRNMILRRPARDRWHAAVAICGFIIPVALTIALSQQQNLFFSRYLIVCLPFFFLTLTYGVDQISKWKPKVAATALLIGLTCVSAVTASARYFDPPHMAWRQAVRYVMGSAQPGDAAIFYGHYSRACFEYYREQWRERSDIPVVLFPAINDPLAMATPWWNVDYAVLPPGGRLAEVIPHYRRVWLIRTETRPDELQMQQYLAATFPDLQKKHLPRIEVYLYSR